MDRVLPSLQRAFGDLGKLSAVDGAERLPSGVQPGDCGHIPFVLRTLDEKGKQCWSHQGQIHCQNQIEFLVGGTESSVNSSQRTTVSKNVLDDTPVGCKLLSRPHDARD